MIFEPFGPYDIQLRAPIIQKELQAEVYAKLGDDVASGCGCYIYGLSSSGGSRITPWYVGKARQSHIGDECSTADKADKINSVIKNFNYVRYEIKLFILARMTSTGRISKPTKADGMTEIDELESLLIGMALRRNSDLINVQGTKIYRQMIVPGLINSPRGRQTDPVKALVDLFGS